MKKKINFEDVKKNLLEHLRDDDSFLDWRDKNFAKDFGVNLSTLRIIKDQLVGSSLALGMNPDPEDWDGETIYVNSGYYFIFGGGGISEEYIEGCSVVKKNKLLLLWYSGQEHVETQYKLGLMHQSGERVIQDHVIGYMWFKIAEANGDTRASEQIDICVKEMTAAQITEAQQLAREWVEKNLKRN